MFTAWSGAVETSRIAVIATETGLVDDLLVGGAGAHYLASGHLVYYAGGGTLRAVGFDEDRLEVTSDSPVPVLEGVEDFIGGWGNFDVSDTGSLVYARNRSVPGNAFVWIDRDGREESLGWEPQPHQTFQLSPAGTQIAVEIDANAGNSDIHVYDLESRNRTQLTFSPERECCPLWSPDGERIVFTSSRDGAPNLYSKAADNSGTVTRLTSGPGAQAAYAWMDGGGTLVLVEDEDLYTLRLDGASAPRPLLETAAREERATVSTDGRWIAYESDESGQDEIHVRSASDVVGSPWIVSLGGPPDDEPLWSHDGQELFYRSPTEMMVVAVETASPFESGVPRALFPMLGHGGGRNRRYDVAPDGRFLFPKFESNDLVVVLNWVDELTQRVPVD